jgi:photosystem II stability/assembly factor-like uncharacterized protein
MKFSTAVLIALVIAHATAVPIHAQITTHWRLSENQLDIKQGGRVNTVAVSPFDPHVMFVASETGGLFKTTSAGSHWFHVDKLPVIFTQSVVFLPSDPFGRVILVSAKADFKTWNGGGVWRSTDGGATWTQTLKNGPAAERLSAFEISVRPGTNTVYVGTSEGFSESSDGGATWSDYGVFTSGDKAVLSVLATNTRVFLGGPSGTRIADATTGLLPVGSNPGPVREMHAFAQRGTTNHVLAVNGDRQLFVTFDSGNFWSRIPFAPQGSPRCAGTPFIKAVERSTAVDLYFSDRCALHRLTAPIDAQGFPHYFGDTWQNADIDHGRPRDLALAGSTALLLGTTAGVHQQTAPNDWHLVGGGREGGLNALQINEVNGQLVPGGLHPDLYVGTHENGLWAATVSGDIASPGGSLAPPASDGHFIDLKPIIGAGEDSRITFRTGIHNRQSERNLFNMQSWPNPQGGQRKAPVLLQPCRYVQTIGTSLIFRSPGMAFTDDCGENWDRFAFFREQTTDRPKVGRDTPDLTLIYQSFRSFGGTGSLMRITKRPEFEAAVGYPVMLPDDGESPAVGLGINATGFGGYQVYAVDPAAVDHLIAPDVVNGRMVESRNGGGTWRVMADLTNQVRNQGHLLFTTDLGGPAAGKVFPIVTAISFFPRFSQLVLAGTSEGGIFGSNDNGGTWYRIAGSEKATYITGFFWESANTVYVSTYGRGLWKLKIRAVAPSESFNDFCSTCDLVSMDGAGRPPFDRSALVFNGHMLGVRTDNQKLREVFVTPGSSVIFTGDPGDPQDDIAITESDGLDPSQYEPLPQPKDGIVSGILFTSDDELVGAAFAKSEMTLPQPEWNDPDVKVSTESPTAGRPYITLNTSGSAAVPTVEAEELFDLSATDFTAGKSYEVLIDGTPLKGELAADGTGSFETRITAPSEPGYHSVAVRMAGDDTVIDRSLFFVRNGN